MPAHQRTILAGRGDPIAPVLVDSPYIEEGDAILVEDLISRSVEAGWIALSWQMIGLETSPKPPCNYREFALHFEEAGLVCGPWEGAAMILAWNGDRYPDQEVDDLIEDLGRIEEAFPKIAG